jgi:pimeloyl-ACP methyl ester carboxylesterase
MMVRNKLMQAIVLNVFCFSTATALAQIAQLAQSCNTFSPGSTAGIALSAEPVIADTTRPPNITTGPTLAAHCIVNGKFGERKGVDGKNYHTGFQLRLPSAWNGRLLYQGGGGNDGIVRPAVGPQATAGYALNRGFAVVTTDAGHQGPSADFGFDPQARLDTAYPAHDRVATLAKKLVADYYGKPINKSYFIGCSGGGRQGMMFTQRFPEHFDGVIAMTPAMRVSKHATIAAAWDTQTLNAIAPKNSEDQPILANAFSNADLSLLRSSILNRCDAADGAADGLVSNPAACAFDPREIQCAGEKTSQCLSAPQVAALKKMFAGPQDSSGKALYFSWPWDAGIGHAQNDWRAWKLGNSQTKDANSRHVFLMQDALQARFVSPPDRSLSIFKFDFDRDPVRMDYHSWIYDTAYDTELKGYKARGGKLLFAHGMADPIFSPHEMIDYYQRLTKTHGESVRDWSRLFLIPGMGHCGGGAATDVWDGLSALVDWVEKGSAPDAIIASGSAVFPGRTRPLCAFPKFAQYNGSGDMENAANFSCRENPR